MRRSVPHERDWWDCLDHDTVFQTRVGWWCIVNGREFGPWPSREEAAPHLATEQQRVAALKASHDRVPLTEMASRSDPSRSSAGGL